MTKILIIDDAPSIVNLVSAYLKPEGYEVFTATDGPSGLKSMRAFKPDLVLLDIMLPGMDGIELLSRLRRESQVYVILLTAKTEETDKVVGLSVGADDYVSKPFSPRELTARVKAALRRIQAGAGSGSEMSVHSFRHLILQRNVRYSDTHLCHPEGAFCAPEGSPRHGNDILRTPKSTGVLRMTWKRATLRCNTKDGCRRAHGQRG